MRLLGTLQQGLVEADVGLHHGGRVALTRRVPHLPHQVLEPERVTEKLRQHTFWQGRRGAVTHAISGIDIALWDLLGQATGQPVGRLLGVATGTGSGLRVASDDRSAGHSR